jgi:crossover junction endodeoxyribonuclease RuvC
MKVLSIDPGYERLGIAILEKKDKRSKEELVYSECFKTNSKLPHHERLFLIGQKIHEIIKKYKPKALATEKLFFNTNQKTVMVVAEARGVILYESRIVGLKIYEYTPLQVKVAVTGYGRSEKKQVIEMVKKLIVVPQAKKSDDEFDAIAIGLTHFAIFRS